MAARRNVEQVARQWQAAHRANRQPIVVRGYRFTPPVDIERIKEEAAKGRELMKEMEAR